MRYLIVFLLIGSRLAAQSISQGINVFLGSSGDHGQLSPAAAYPFGMVSVCPQTYPHGHTGYEYKAKIIRGFTHTRFEGVGCMGSGGNILITPFMEGNSSPLIKKEEFASPGNYAITFTSGISAAIAVGGYCAIEQYHFPGYQNGFTIDLSHTLANAFKAERHQSKSDIISGWIRSGTTCNMGSYVLYYAISFDRPVKIASSDDHVLRIRFNARDITVRVGFSAFSVERARFNLGNSTFGQLADEGKNEWEQLLGRIQVQGNPHEQDLFYSLLYRVLQSPYVVSDPGTPPRYNGWTVWDNYKTQLPLLSLTYPEKYPDIIASLAGLYTKGKKNWATDHEPSNTVRTEHSIVVLLDAYRKGYAVDFSLILDSLKRETDSLKFDKPDKALESCYDAWAMSEICTIAGRIDLKKKYRDQAAQWKNYWTKDFKDITKKDVDALPARGMYQGTIWQYRWLIPYDVKGLIAVCGGESAYIDQLNHFFNNDYYNAANETDIQVPYMYSGTSQPWRSQEIIHRYAHDTVVQYYFNDNSRGIDPFIDRIYQNKPDAYPRTMDDDGGAMSGWYVLAAMGLSPACVGYPVWYVHVPLFEKITLQPGDAPFNIIVKNFEKENKYIGSLSLNGKQLDRVWLAHEEIAKGGELIITASSSPNKNLGNNNKWISSIKE